jgi:hypothetical protein
MLLDKLLYALSSLSMDLLMQLDRLSKPPYSALLLIAFIKCEEKLALLKQLLKQHNLQNLLDQQPTLLLLPSIRRARGFPCF